MDCPDYTDFLETTLWLLLKEYKPNNIYNTDETSLFYKTLANRTYAFSAETVRGSKYLNSKDRLILMLCTNITGTDKLSPLIIGKAAQPLKRKGIGLSDLNIDYYHSSNDWMTAVVFEHWLGKWNERLARQKCHIFLLVDVDNDPSHITKEYLNIRVQYLPPNSTSKLQPQNQGIICVCVN